MTHTPRERVMWTILIAIVVLYALIPIAQSAFCRGVNVTSRPSAAPSWRRTP